MSAAEAEPASDSRVLASTIEEARSSARVSKVVDDDDDAERSALQWSCHKGPLPSLPSSSPSQLTKVHDKASGLLEVQLAILVLIKV